MTSQFLPVNSDELLDLHDSISLSVYANTIISDLLAAKPDVLTITAATLGISPEISRQILVNQIIGHAGLTALSSVAPLTVSTTNWITTNPTIATVAEIGLSISPSIIAVVASPIDHFHPIKVQTVAASIWQISPPLVQISPRIVQVVTENSITLTAPVSSSRAMIRRSTDHNTIVISVPEERLQTHRLVTINSVAITSCNYSIRVHTHNRVTSNELTVGIANVYSTVVRLVTVNSQNVLLTSPTIIRTTQKTLSVNSTDIQVSGSTLSRSTSIRRSVSDNVLTMNTSPVSARVVRLLTPTVNDITLTGPTVSLRSSRQEVLSSVTESIIVPSSTINTSITRSVTSNILDLTVTSVSRESVRVVTPTNITLPLLAPVANIHATIGRSVSTAAQITVTNQSVSRRYHPIFANATIAMSWVAPPVIIRPQIHRTLNTTNIVTLTTSAQTNGYWNAHREVNTVACTLSQSVSPIIRSRMGTNTLRFEVPTLLCHATIPVEVVENSDQWIVGPNISMTTFTVAPRRVEWIVSAPTSQTWTVDPILTTWVVPSLVDWETK